MSSFLSDSTVEFPFDPTIHVHCPELTPEQVTDLANFKELIVKSLNDAKIEFTEEHKKWADDQQLQRFLIARNYNLKEAYKIFEEAIQWRNKRKPDQINPLDSEWAKILHTEGETGKIFCPGKHLSLSFSFFIL